MSLLLLLFFKGSSCAARLFISVLSGAGGVPCPSLSWLFFVGFWVVVFWSCLLFFVRFFCAFCAFFLAFLCLFSFLVWCGGASSAPFLGFVFLFSFCCGSFFFFFFSCWLSFAWFFLVWFLWFSFLCSPCVCLVGCCCCASSWRSCFLWVCWWVVWSCSFVVLLGFRFSGFFVWSGAWCFCCSFRRSCAFCCVSASPFVGFFSCSLLSFGASSFFFFFSLFSGAWLWLVGFCCFCSWFWCSCPSLASFWGCSSFGVGFSSLWCWLVVRYSSSAFILVIHKKEEPFSSSLSLFFFVKILRFF